MAINLDMVAQIGITVLGVSAAALVSLKSSRYRRWGFLCGLLSQPFWFYTLAHHGQWTMILLAVFYTATWTNGLRNNWRQEGGG